MDIFNKNTHNNHISKNSYISSIKKDIMDLCHSLNYEVGQFDAKISAEKVIYYFKKDGRILYSEIDGYIERLNENDIGRFRTNLNQLLDYILNKNEFLKDFPNISKNYNDIKKFSLKIWDHINLTTNQAEKFIVQNNAKQMFFEQQKIIDDKQAKFSKSINSQLISIVGIFTAMSFLVFSGLNSIDEVFKVSYTNGSLLKMIIMLLIWGICILNTVFVFMFFVAKFVGEKDSNNTVSSKDVGKNIKDFMYNYSVVFWVNFILVNLLTIFLWLYFAKYDFMGWYSEIFKNMNIFWQNILVIGSLISVDFLILRFRGTFKRRKTANI